VDSLWIAVDSLWISHVFQIALRNGELPQIAILDLTDVPYSSLPLAAATGSAMSKGGRGTLSSPLIGSFNTKSILRIFWRWQYESPILNKLWRDLSAPKDCTRIELPRSPSAGQ
jgi:hypothetical protein